MSMCMEKSINYTEKQEIMTMSITGECVKAKLTDCMTMKKATTRSLAMLIGIEEYEMEIVKPLRIKGGLSLTIYFYAGDRNIDFGELINDANDSNELENCFQTGWNLSSPPVIKIINTVVIESKEKKRLHSEEQIVSLHIMRILK